MGNRVFFTDPNGTKDIITDTGNLKRRVIDSFSEFWIQGSGDGYLEFYEDDELISTLMLGPNVDYGLYLHFIDRMNHMELLSLYDENRLSEVAETAEEIYASIGLFLPVELAWEGILEFVKTGEASSKIRWIMPDQIPENGNW